MAKAFSEIVVEGPFMLVKGFLLGFLSCHNPDAVYFFHRKSHIRRETFKELLKEFFELENVVHFCLEADLVKPFMQATEMYTRITGYQIKSIRPIREAEFSFNTEIFDPEFADTFKNIIEQLPSHVQLLNYHPSEFKDEEARALEAYSPVHNYVFRAQGMVRGDFETLVNTYLKIKRSDFSDFVLLSDIKLSFA